MMSETENSVHISLGDVGNNCFVIMPFGTAMDRVYEKVFKPAIEASGVVSVRGDEVFGSRRIMADIWDSIRASRCVLAELTGKNANVLYELGLCHAVGKPVIIVTSNMDDVPFDLQDIRCIVYDRDHPDWGEKLKGAITSTIDRVNESHDPTELLRDIRVVVSYPEVNLGVACHPPVEQRFDVTGKWLIKEVYKYGRTDGELDLRQNGEELSGVVEIRDFPDDGNGFSIRQVVSGSINGSEIRLSGTSFQVVDGDPFNYNLDEWKGVVKNSDFIFGTSTDDSSTTGKFEFRRIDG